MSTFIPTDAWEPPYPKTIVVKIKGVETEVEIEPEDVDVRSFDYMPLDIKILFTSELWLSATDEEKVAAITLWARSWHQVPAASLPSQEAKLAHMAGYGRDLRAWRRVKEMALRGFRMATDGRLYHPVVADFALKAFKGIRAQKGNSARRWKKAQPTEINRNRPKPRDNPKSSPASSAGNSAGYPIEGRGGEESKKKEVEAPGSQSAAPQPATGEQPPAPAPTKRGTRLPDGWAPDQSLIDYAKTLGFSIGQIERITANFCDFWHAKPGTKALKLDWGLTFKTWVRGEDPKKVRGIENPGTAGGHQSSVNELQWRLRLQAFRDKNFWPSLAGKNPLDELCDAPRTLLIEFGYRNEDGSMPSETTSSQQRNPKRLE